MLLRRLAQLRPVGTSSVSTLTCNDAYSETIVMSVSTTLALFRRSLASEGVVPFSLLRVEQRGVCVRLLHC